MATQWSAVKHKASASRREQIKKEALAEYLAARSGMARLRMARGETQVSLAGRLAVPQSVISRMERGSNPQFKTLQRFVEGLGGRLEISAVFPDDTIDLSELVHEAADGKAVLQPLLAVPRKRNSDNVEVVRFSRVHKGTPVTVRAAKKA